MKKLILIALLSVLPAWAQSEKRYIASASTTALTIQQPAANGLQVSFGVATVYCAAAQTATLSWNGAAATATAGTAKAIPPTFSGASATVWTGSNAGSGTTGPVYQVPLGLTINIDLTSFGFGNTGSASNLTITTSGSCTITIPWTER